MELNYTLNEIGDVAKIFWKEIKPANVIAFHGEMGAGKTTFIHAVCDFLKVKDVVSSPSFSLINEYYFQENGQQRKLFHIDLYRLRNEEEAVQAGIEDCLYSDHICFVEWPERAPGLFPANTRQVFIEVTDSQTRKLKIGGN
jgi:tRNA threonylcarbamoyladenosine biosynthesis protein TsaE